MCHGGEGRSLGPLTGMPRKRRTIVAGGVYHVYARGNRRHDIFLGDDDRRDYLSIWGAVAQEFGWRCLAYCLMDNHVHHLVEIEDPNLSAGVQIAHGTYGRRFNDAAATVGHLFEGRFGATLARTPGLLWYFAGYIALNPVRAKMCARPEDHRWSSHAAVVGKARPPAWLAVDRLLSFYDRGDGDPLSRYSQVVEALRVMGAAGFEPSTSRL